MTFIQKISAYNLGFLTDQDLPDIALTGLSENLDSLSLRILAGYNERENPFLLADTFTNTLKEIDVSLPDRRQCLINVITHYAAQITCGTIDAYSGFDAIDTFVRKTEFSYQDLNLDQCYAEYITIWELKTDGIQMYTGSGLTKKHFIDKTKMDLATLLAAWLG